jgi:hypothetical protein
MSKHRRRKNGPKKTGFVHELSVGITDAEIIGVMQEAKQLRDGGAMTLTCVIDGFNDDPRELGDIPEARELCRRLVALGYVSFLDVITSAKGFPTYNGGRTLGAFEVWRIARDEVHEVGLVEIDTTDLLRFVEKDLPYLNTVADDHLTAN